MSALFFIFCYNIINEYQGGIILKIAVYCGSSLGNNIIYEKYTKKLGIWIGQNNHTLVYGGGKQGLMGVIAKTVLEKNGEVIGIMPDFLSGKEVAFKDITKFILAADMNDRKRKIFEEAEAFIALPGGSGTLEEISEVISWIGIGKNNKPCILYNIDGFYDNLKKQYEFMCEKGFFNSEVFKKVLFSDNLVEIEEFIKNYEPIRFVTY